MDQFLEAIQFLAAAGMGLFVGALLAEAMVMVPIWRTLQAQEFFRLHTAHAHRLYSFFAPLTVSATCLALAAGVLSMAFDHPGRLASLATAFLSLLILATYFLYFQRANASFAQATVTHEDLPAELTRWAAWHGFRTVIGLLALVTALLALRAAP
jgi:uncharacterized membrane protein